MSSDLPVRVRKPARRTHAERTAETRRRVLDAVVESLAEVGFQRTTGSEIARRAGVSWGAIQHHFGDKNGILAAALEASFERFAAGLGAPAASGGPLAARVAEFVERAWAHFGSQHYRSTFEILHNMPPELEAAWPAGMLGAWHEIWQRYFPESRLSERETVDLMYYAVSVLSGLATTAMLEGRNERALRRGLAFLERTLLEELAPDAAPAGRGV